MKTKVYSQTRNIRNTLANLILSRRVKKKDFTIVSVDCWGSSIYQEMGLGYNTPFVGLFFYAPCFITLLSNLEQFLQSDLEFIETSKYPSANEDRRGKAGNYPIGLLGGEVEIHFLHYESEEDARAKWNVRRARMNMDNLFVEFSDRNLCTKEHLLAFDNLPFRNKVVFTAQKHPDVRSAVWLSEFAAKPHIDNIYNKAYYYKRHFDMADWLNGGRGQVRPLYRLVSKLLEVR